LKFIIYLICMGLLVALMVVVFKSSHYELEEANNFYFEGEKATTVAEKKAAFNHALTLYLSAEQEYSPKFGDGKLYFNIGNTYFQLGEYPLALFYYKRAQQLMPRSEMVQESIEQVNEILQLKEEASQPTFWQKTFTPMVRFSVPEELQLFALSGIIALIAASCYLWMPHPLLKQTKTIFVFISVILLLGLARAHYMTPIQGVIIHAVEMRRSDSKESAKVSGVPIPPGTTVNLIDIEKKSSWVKVSTSDGDLGYIPKDSVRFL